MSVLASAAAQQSGGWGYVVALVVPWLLITGWASAHKRWQSVKAGDHSPTPPADTTITSDPQVSEGVTPVDPTSGPVDHGWGAVDYSTASGREVVPPRDTTAARPKASRGDVARWLRGRVGKAGTNQLIRDAGQELGASESTVKRALRDVKAGGGAK